MNKGLSRILTVMVAAILFGSSAFVVQFWPQLDKQFKSAAAEPVVSTLAAAEGRALTNIAELQAEIRQLKVMEAVQNAASAKTEQEKAATEAPAEAKKTTAKTSPRTVVSTRQTKATVPVTKKPDTAAPVSKKTEATAPTKPVTEPQVKATPVPTQTTEPPTPQASETEASVPKPEPAPKVEEKKTPANPYSVGSSREFRVLSQAIVKNTGDALATNVRIQVPLITTSSLYYSRRGESFSLEPTEIKSVNGTRMGVFNLGELAPGQEVSIAVHTRVRTANISFYADYVPTGGKKVTSYLGSASGIETTNGKIVSLANQLTSGLTADWDKARAITRWVATNISYNASAANRNSGALTALNSRTGVCEDYAKLSAALARAAGIPARVVYGYTDSGSKWPSSGSLALRGYRHAWVEFHLVGRGWVPADPTRSSSSKLYFGKLPHNRYIIQNYNNQSLKGNYSGGKLSISWADSLE
ncbi:MAG TPA: transglutaminase domain-containing protein [Oscillospiraceae bacterium]|nr:transglutaminase domain-containing protein [Oscillospiraceae bacterium]